MTHTGARSVSSPRSTKLNMSVTARVFETDVPQLTLGSSNDQVILQNREVFSINSETFERHGALLLLLLSMFGDCQGCGDGRGGREDKGTGYTNDEHVRSENVCQYGYSPHFSTRPPKFGLLIPPIATRVSSVSSASRYSSVVVSGEVLDNDMHALTEGVTFK